jgi:hypothetical protein
MTGEAYTVDGALKGRHEGGEKTVKWASKTDLWLP